jgi:NAD(P)-dependent dehydrogenase (short-subunit alcohol dehydrogenase family)
VLAIDHTADGVRVNAVCPTWVRTPMVEEECKKNPAVLEMVQAIVPLKRMADPEEIADTIVYLCSPSASYISGTGLIIDGGVTLTVHMH